MPDLTTMPEQRTNNGDEIHLLDMVIILARRRRLILAVTVLGGLLAAGISLVQTPIFVSTAKILPPQQSQSSGVASMLGQLGGLPGVGGLGALKGPNDLYVGLLESRTIADSLTARFKLKERYEADTMDATRKQLSVNTVIVSGKKDGMISISVSDKDPTFAAQLANAYVDELTRLTQTMALTEASQRRVFFEKQLQHARDQLTAADAGLRQTQEKTGMIQPEGQVQAIISNLSQLKSAIAAKEVQLNAMRSFATGNNPDVRRLQEELRGMRAQLAKLEKTQPMKQGDFLVPTGEIPAVGAEYVRSVRNVKYYETVYEVLAKQFEVAKIDEAKESTLIQVLDAAVPPELRSKPRRSMMTLAGLGGGFVLGLIIAFLCEAYRRSRASPQGLARWAALSGALK
jgi:tyrosine-protein kinase Etk/Wzc